MSTRSLTVAAVARIKPPRQGQAEHFDQGFPGLALRVSYGGQKAWTFFYRLHGGKLKRLTLGHYPAMDLAQARNAWRSAREVVGKGENPARKKPTHADSFVAVADEWLKRDQAHNRSCDRVKRIIERDVKPVWDGRLIASINRRDVRELIDAIADRGAVTLARRVHAHLHRLFRWSAGRDIIEFNPMADLPKPGAEVKRDRVLSDVELVLLWKAAGKVGWPFGPITQLLILTGARKMEVGALRWSEIDGDLILLKETRTKNAQSHTIPLSKPALAIIEALPRMAESELVFTRTGGTVVSGWSKAKTTLDATIKDLDGRVLPAWRLHDIRRSVATGLQRLGASLQCVEAILGHVSGSRAGIVGVYQRHQFDDEKLAALEMWARHVEGLISGKSAKVVLLKKAARS
jgi:integrase